MADGIFGRLLVGVLFFPILDVGGASCYGVETKFGSNLIDGLIKLLFSFVFFAVKKHELPTLMGNKRRESHADEPYRERLMARPYFE